MRAIIPSTLRSVTEMPINLGVEQVRRHKQQLQYFFTKFSEQLEEQVYEPFLAYKIDGKQFDNSGALWFRESDLDQRSLKLVQTIEDSYMSTSFFTAANGKIGSRGYVYYASAARDDDSMRAILRLINHADTSARLLRDLYSQHKNRWEFGIYALLDDIRYKLLLIDELDGAITRDNVNLLNQSIIVFYDYVELFPDAPETLKALKESGKHLALITTSERRMIMPVLEKYNIADLFETVITDDDIEKAERKPHPRPLLMALECMGGTPDKAIMVGDRDKDIVAGRNAGTDSVLFCSVEHQRHYNLEKLMEHKPTYIISEFRDLVRVADGKLKQPRL
jgi:HAD superfamily hydrolase (TIGR01549 family)